MARMPQVTFVGRPGVRRFANLNPVGCILHRPENPNFERSLDSYRHAPHWPHFLVGKQGQIAQITDTSEETKHVGNANAHYIGIEVSSVTSRWPNRQDPQVIRDSLTLPQADSLRSVVDWVASTHLIPKVGPPSLREMRDAYGHWQGFCNHADVSLVIPSRGDHEEGFEDQEFMRLGIWPSGSRHGLSNMTELLPRLDEQAMTSAERTKVRALDLFLKKLGKKVTP